MTSPQDVVCFGGLFIFVVGLFNGLIIAKSKSPRLSLSAHLTAVQSGTFLIAIAWAWPRFTLPAATSIVVAWVLVGSMCGLWFAFFLAGIWGAGRNLAIAGEGSETGPVKQRIVGILLGLGVVGTITACTFLLFQWDISVTES